MENNKLFTAVERFSNQTYELFEQYSEGRFDRVQLNKLMVDATNKAKEMEKQQMIKFAEYVETYPDKNRNVNGEILHAKSKYDGAERTIDLLEQYYNETYGSKGISLQNQSKSKVITELSDCINCDEAKPTHNICMDCVIKIGKQNQTEISDNDIEKASYTFWEFTEHTASSAWKLGAKWYREQLNKL